MVMVQLTQKGTDDEVVSDDKKKGHFFMSAMEGIQKVGTIP
jgi:hypothetical protein